MVDDLYLKSVTVNRVETTSIVNLFLIIIVIVLLLYYSFHSFIISFYNPL